MALMELPEVRQNVETSLHDDALARIMAAVEEDIDQRHGAVGSQVDIVPGGLKSIWTTRPIGSITSVIERVGTTDTTLETDDYDTLHGSQLDRIETGTNARLSWGDRITITYTPVDTTNRRITAYLKLIQLEINYSGLDNSREGDFSSKGLDFARERERVLSSLRLPGAFI